VWAAAAAWPWGRLGKGRGTSPTSRAGSDCGCVRWAGSEPQRSCHDERTPWPQAAAMASEADRMAVKLVRWSCGKRLNNDEMKACPLRGCNSAAAGLLE